MRLCGTDREGDARRDGRGEFTRLYNVMLTLQPVIDRLPVGFDAIRTEAGAEGYRFIERLIEEWAIGTRISLGKPC